MELFQATEREGVDTCLMNGLREKVVLKVKCILHDRKEF